MDDDVVIAHWQTCRDVAIFDDRGGEVVFYLPSHDLYVMHPLNIIPFERMMRAAGMTLSDFGVNNA